MKKKRVLIVEDSRTVRAFLCQIIDSDGRLEVAAAVASAEEALRVLRTASPDVISMDVRLPGMDGIEATRRIMAEHPTPIVVVSATVDRHEAKTAMDALEAGALAAVEKPWGSTRVDFLALARRLCTQLVVMSEVKVVRQRFNRPRLHMTMPTRGARRHSLHMVGIVASTGGPAALQRLLVGLGKEFPLPIMLVQHITASFHDSFVSWLDSICPFSVTSARHGEQPLAGQVYVAPPDRHLTIDAGRVCLCPTAKVCFERPSGTVLFRSLACALGPAALGVVLTGMGADGAEGLAELRAAGGFTIAEDASTATVFGMPSAAEKLGAACEMLPLDQIAPRIIQLVPSPVEVS